MLAEQCNTQLHWNGHRGACWLAHGQHCPTGGSVVPAKRTASALKALEVTPHSQPAHCCLLGHLPHSLPDCLPASLLALFGCLQRLESQAEHAQELGSRQVAGLCLNCQVAAPRAARCCACIQGRRHAPVHGAQPSIQQGKGARQAWLGGRCCGQVCLQQATKSQTCHAAPPEAQPAKVLQHRAVDSDAARLGQLPGISSAPRRQAEKGSQATRALAISLP